MGMKKKTIEEVKNIIEDDNSGCKLLSKEYSSINSKLLLECKCGNIFTVSLNNFMHRNQRQCSKCGYENGVKNQRFAFDDVKKYIEVHSESSCKLISTEYKNAHEKILLECCCGNTFKTSLKEFKYNNKRQCNDCGHKISRHKQSFDYEYVKNYIEVDSNSGCRLLSQNYINNREKLIIKCSCGDVFEVCFDKFKDRGKQQCNNCTASKGEKRVEEYLKQNDVLYAPQYTFDDLFGVGGGILRFDFAMFNIEGNLELLIEYDGELHYIDRPLQSSLETRQQNDNIKNQYCENNNIPLLRIPYWDFDNIEQILCNELKIIN